MGFRPGNTVHVLPCVKELDAIKTISTANKGKLKFLGNCLVKEDSVGICVNENTKQIQSLEPIKTEPQLRIQKNEAEYKNTRDTMQTPKSVSVIDASNVFWTSSDDCINRILGTSTFHKRKSPKSSSSSRDLLQKGSYYDDLSVNKRPATCSLGTKHPRDMEIPEKLELDESARNIHLKNLHLNVPANEKHHVSSSFLTLMENLRQKSKVQTKYSDGQDKRIEPKIVDLQMPKDSRVPNIPKKAQKPFKLIHKDNDKKISNNSEKENASFENLFNILLPPIKKSKKKRNKSRIILNYNTKRVDDQLIVNENSSTKKGCNILDTGSKSDQFSVSITGDKLPIQIPTKKIACSPVAIVSKIHFKEIVKVKQVVSSPKRVVTPLNIPKTKDPIVQVKSNSKPEIDLFDNIQDLEISAWHQ